MKIQFGKLSDIELVQLIQSASEELGSRISTAPIVKRVQAVERVVVVREPGLDDKDFVLMIKGLLKEGGYVKAGERRRVSAIAAKYPEWVRRQGLPEDSGTGSWKAAQQYFSAARAKER